MNFQPHIVRIPTLPIATLLLIIAAAALSPVRAAVSQAESEAERQVLKQIQEDKGVDSAKFLYYADRSVIAQLEVPAAFIAKLLTGRDARMRNQGERILIRDVIISGMLDLRNQDIPYDLLLANCTFKDAVDFSGSRFTRGVFIADSRSQSVDFSNATISENFYIDRLSLSGPSAKFNRMHIGGDVYISKSTFLNETTSFAGIVAGRQFEVEDSSFGSKTVSFAGLQASSLSFLRCGFGFHFDADDKALFGRPNAKVSFASVHVADFILGYSNFENVSAINFSRLQADTIYFNGAKSKPPSDLNLEHMTFKLIRPVDAQELQEFLLFHYNPEFYTAVEASLRTNGYLDEADKIFIAKKRAQRRENCKDVFNDCKRGTWVWSVFQDVVAGYGKSLQNLLYWSIGFLVIGTFVFRNEKGMKIKDLKDVSNYEGRYQAFWYSLDLFLPIIKLGEADVWTPKNDRHWANLYKKVHIIIGSLFVPIGLAAWTGIIK